MRNRSAFLFSYRHRSGYPYALSWVGIRRRKGRGSPHSQMAVPISLASS